MSNLKPTQKASAHVDSGLGSRDGWHPLSCLEFPRVVVTGSLMMQVQEVLSAAHGLAEDNGHSEISPVHIALAIMDDAEGIGRAAVARAGGEEGAQSFGRVLKKGLVRLPRVEPAPTDIGLSRLGAQVLRQVAFPKLAWPRLPYRTHAIPQ